MKRKIKQNQGITIIALIVTIIILLILTGISIGIIVDGNFFNKVESSMQKTQNQEEQWEESEQEAQTIWDETPGTSIKSNTTGN